MSICDGACRYLSPEQAKEDKHFKLLDKETGIESKLEVECKESFVEWLAENYKQYGCSLDFITDNSQEGSQFVRGFGGIGGIIRWQVLAIATRYRPTTRPSICTEPPYLSWLCSDFWLLTCTDQVDFEEYEEVDDVADSDEDNLDAFL